MADSTSLPNDRAALVDSSGQVTRIWFQFFRGLGVAPEAAPVDLSGFLPDTVTVLGPASIKVDGTLGAGAATFRLDGDSPAPGNSRYYGTNALGVKGFYSLPGLAGESTITVPAAALQHRETIAAVGVTAASVVSIGLRSVLDADENDPELLDAFTLWGAPGTDTIDVYASFAIPVSGPIKINWRA